MNLVTLLFCTMLYVSSSCAVNESDSCVTPAVPQYGSQFFIDDNGKIFLPKFLPIQFNLSIPSNVTGTILATSAITTHKLSNVMKLAEGLNTICNETLVDSLKNQDGVRQCFELWADGTAPETREELSGAKFFQNEKNRYFGNGLKFSLRARDSCSGVKKTFLSINGEKFSPLTDKPYDFSKDQKFCLQYYSLDNVGNCEIVKHYEFISDVSPPQSIAKIEGIFNKTVLSSKASLFIESMDGACGIKSIFYSINRGEIKLYDKLIPFTQLPNGMFSLEFFAEDNVGNIEATQNQQFFYDSTAPQITFSVIGDSRKEKSVCFVSTRSKIKLDTSDALCGVDYVKYQIDNLKNHIYEKPFRLPDLSKLCKVVAVATDRVRNQSSENVQLFYVDVSPPATTFHISKQMFCNGDTISTILNAGIELLSKDYESGVKQLLFSINDCPEALYLDTLFFKNEGIYKLVYHAVDNVFNSENEHTYFIRVTDPAHKPSAIEPELYAKSWISDKNGLIGSSNQPFFIRIAASPCDSAQSFLLTPIPGEEPFYFNSNGDNSLKILLTKQNREFKIKVDAFPPLTSIQWTGSEMYKSDGFLYSRGGLSISLLARDTLVSICSGSAKTFYSVNGSPFLIYNKSLQIFSNEQEYSLRYYSVDSVGNMENVNTSEFVIDNSAPTTEIDFDNMLLGTIISDKSKITLKSADNLCGVKTVWSFFDSGKPIRYVHALTGKNILMLSDGEHTFHYYAIDNVGNIEKEKVCSIIVDHSLLTSGL